MKVKDKINRLAEKAAAFRGGNQVGKFVSEFASILNGIPVKYYRNTMFSLEMEGVTVLYTNPRVIKTRDGYQLVLNARYADEKRDVPATISKMLASESMNNIAFGAKAKFEKEERDGLRRKEITEIIDELQTATERKNN